MNKVKVYNLEGVASGEVNLLPEIFAVKENNLLVSEAVRIERANIRQSIAHTKTRGEVSGGGKKPYKQKGTGNARAGSTRSPLWTGGGVTFGPRKERNFSLRMPRKTKQAAIKIVLTEKAVQERLIIVKDLDLKEISTKNFAKILEKLPIEEGKILIILDKVNAELELSVANLPYIKVIKAENLNMLDLAKYDYLLITEAAFAKIEQNSKVNK